MVMTMHHPSPDTPSSPGQDLLSVFLSLNTPPGYREELIDREIVVTPPPDGGHEGIIGYIIRALIRGTDKFVTLPTKGIVTPRGRYIPDLTVTAPGIFDSAPSWAQCTGVELVVEVTSARADNDRRYKRLGYAEAGVPQYLLVDREQHRVTVFSDPNGGDYRASASVDFGGKLRLEEPFGFDIDTSEFPV